MAVKKHAEGKRAEATENTGRNSRQVEAEQLERDQNESAEGEWDVALSVPLCGLLGLE